MTYLASELPDEAVPIEVRALWADIQDCARAQIYPA